MAQLGRRTTSGAGRESPHATAGVPMGSEPASPEVPAPADAVADPLRADRASAAFHAGQSLGPAAPARPRSSGRGHWLRIPPVLQQLLASRKAAFGLVVLTLMVLMAIFAPLLTHYHPSVVLDTLPDQSPSPDHWFGTNHQGEDIFAQVAYGARVSLFVGCAAALVATLVSAALGMTSAYVGGWVDNTLNLMTNIFLVIPSLPLLIVISSYLPSRGPLSMMLIIAFTTWAGEERVLRSQALTLRSRDFVLAAASVGEPLRRIVFSEIMPNMVSRITAGFLGSFVGAILYEAGLEFLGFGDVNSVSWGTTLFWAQNNHTLIFGEWWHFTFPGVAIALTAAALIFVNYGMDEISNPRLQTVKLPTPKELARDKALAALLVTSRGG